MPVTPPAASPPSSWKRLWDRSVGQAQGGFGGLGTATSVLLCLIGASIGSSLAKSAGAKRPIWGALLGFGASLAAIMGLGGKLIGGGKGAAPDQLMWDRLSKSGPEGLKIREHALDPAEFPTLTRLGRNFSVQALENRAPPLVGREEETEAVFTILRRMNVNSPVLVGEAGVGKTALVEGLAGRMLTTPDFEDKILISLDLTGILAGKGIRGTLEAEIGNLLRELDKAKGKVIVYVDEIHRLVGAGATHSDPNSNVAQMLKSALARGGFPCIGSTTLEEYRTHILPDATLNRRFKPVFVEEPTDVETLDIARVVAKEYERHHKVTFEDGVVEYAVAHSKPAGGHNPDRTLQVLDGSAALAAQQRRATVTQQDVVTSVRNSQAAAEALRNAKAA